MSSMWCDSWDIFSVSVNKVSILSLKLPWFSNFDSPVDQIDNYRSGSPNGFITNNGSDNVITEQYIGTRGEYETAANDDNNCLEVEDCDDDNDNSGGGDCDAEDGGGDCGNEIDDWLIKLLWYYWRFYLW